MNWPERGITYQPPPFTEFHNYMHYFNLCAFSQLVGEKPKDVKDMIQNGLFKHVKRRADRVELGADDALNYLAQKYPQLIAAKSELNALAAGRVNEQIVKETTSNETVKKGAGGDCYIYDN